MVEPGQLETAMFACTEVVSWYGYPKWLTSSNRSENSRPTRHNNHGFPFGSGQVTGRYPTCWPPEVR